MVRGSKDRHQVMISKVHEHFPKIKFTVRNICFKNIFDIVETIAVMANWDIDLTGRDGNWFIKVV